MKISKRQAAQLAEHAKTLRAQREALDDAFVELCRRLREHTDKYNAIVEAHNHSVAEARHFVGEIAETLRDEWDGKSEGWQESDRGRQAEAMVEAWECSDLNDVEPVAVLMPDRPHFEESLNLPESEEDA